MTRTIWIGLAAAALAATTAVACGGSSSSNPTTPTTPTPPATGGGGGTVTDSATITIGANGAVSPASVTITRGGRVTFVNSDSRPHDMSSDPHPEHTACPELNQVGFLNAGQSRASGNLNTARTCTYHDHNLPDSAGLKGLIVIQ